MATTRSQRWGDSYWLSLTVHSRPSVRAGCERLAEPMYAHAELGVAVEQVRLGVQPRAVGVVRHAHLGVWAVIRSGRQPSSPLRRGSLL